MTLDSVLNVLVPFIIFGIIIIFIYSKAKNPIDKFFGKIRDLIQKALNPQESDEGDSSEEYRIEYRGAEW